MFSRNTAIVWIGICILSGMFLMGQDGWHPSAPAKVFVSYNAVDGSISFGEKVGVAAADAICQAEAWEYNLSGEFKAWISDDYSSPDTRFSKYGSPYELPSGTVVANNWQDLTDGTLIHVIGEEADGTQLPFGIDVWTNTFEDGTAANVSGQAVNDSCDNWLSTDAPTGIYGEIGPLFWSYKTTGSCSSYKRLYCFEQI
jgi:hypothetical protein